MGGIGKTIIAMFAFNDVKHIHDSLCFIEIAQNSGNNNSKLEKNQKI